MPTVNGLHIAPSGRDLVQAKTSARRAYDKARKSGALAPVLIDRLWCEMLLAAEKQEREDAAEMFRRSEHLFVLLWDRSRWAR